VGLTWAFFVAGVPAQVVSQWAVADESTAELMKRFYANLKRGMGKGAALREAQRSFIRANRQSSIANPQWNHPYYWAPFVLMGDWR